MMSSIWGVAADVGSFWRKKAYGWLTKKSPRNTLLDALNQAQSFEEWEEIAFRLDEIDGSDLWRQDSTSKYYDFRLIYERLQAIIIARDDEDVLGLISLLRSGLVRNLGNITTSKLFNTAYAGTKLLIEDYVTQFALAIEYVTSLPTINKLENGWSSQAKLDLLHDTRQAFGRSTLVLQGGAIFGLCHLGVVKALYLRGLLPRIITGTATGSLIAALVAIHTEEELLDFLNGDGIDITAFQAKTQSGRPKLNDDLGTLNHASNLMQTLTRRTQRYFQSGYFLDINVLEECVRTNVGDMTFEEAYARTKRVLNITVATSGRGGVPNLLNYITAPNVLIWSAALASNASTTTLRTPQILRCKDETGAVVPWASAQEITFRSWRQANYADRDSPLSRIAELFNVNHFLVSQARPYIVPFLRSDLHMPDPRLHRAASPLTPLLRIAALEVHHRLKQLDDFGLLPTQVRRLLIDESIPGPGITLVPSVRPSDFLMLLETPTREVVDYWVLVGERSVWPAVGALKVRCAVEVELDRGYQMVRRRKPMDGGGGAVRRVGSKGSIKGKGKRRRAVSVEVDSYGAEDMI